MIRTYMDIQKNSSIYLFIINLQFTVFHKIKKKKGKKKERKKEKHVGGVVIDAKLEDWEILQRFFGGMGC